MESIFVELIILNIEPIKSFSSFSFRGVVISWSTLSICILLPNILVLTVVSLSFESKIPSLVMFSFFIKERILLAFGSCPTTEHKIGLAPIALIFNATFAAPPKRSSVLTIVAIGTGASGEILSTFPHMYESIITSPIIKMFNPSNLLNIFLYSINYILN